MIEVVHNNMKLYVNNKNILTDLPNLEKVAKSLPDNPICVDCGASYGNHTVFYAKVLKAKRVTSFEPHPESYIGLHKTILANNLEDTVTIYNHGLSARFEDIGLFATKPEYIGALQFLYKSELVESPIDSVTAESKPLDSVISTYVDYLKIDVEGMEMEVLEGAKKLISKYRPIIFIEVWGKNKVNRELFKSWMKVNRYENVCRVSGPNFLIRSEK